MAQALQAVDAPDVLLRDMVRVGKQAGNYYFSKLCALEDSLFSCIKRNDACIGSLPYMWYNTPTFIYVHLKISKHYVLKIRYKLLIDSPSMEISREAC